MRPFNGKMANLPGVSCDHFAGDNKNSDQFFLSHCHSDHMIGLEELFPLLRRKNSVKVNHKIFCHSISKAFLLNKFKKVDPKHIYELKVGKTETIWIYNRESKDSYKVNVTCVQAQHCPGSVMFLFQREDLDVRVLYTGDFRLENTNLADLEPLHDNNGKPFKIDQMYLDTTFCSRDYEHFPPRHEAIDAIWRLVTFWIKKNGMYRNQRPKHVVLLRLAAQYGSEAILNSIYERSETKWKVHVNKEKLGDYLCTEDLSNSVDDKFDQAQWIHAFCWSKEDKKENKSHRRDLPCNKNEPFTVRQIKPSAMFFTKEKLEKHGINCHEGGEFHRVCYSCHSSLEELQEFVKYFQPASICPIVLPPKCSNVHQVLDLLLPVIEDSESVKSNSQNVFDFGPSPPSPVTSQRTLFPGSPLACEFLDSPPKKRNLDLEDCKIQRKRKRFQWSRTDRVTCSMPVIGDETGDSQNGSRRASLPANIKIPDITITPSTPSPEPQEFESTSIELWKSWKTFDEDEDVIMSDSRCSTPDLQEVLDSAKNEEERKRVLKYQEKHNV